MLIFDCIVCKGGLKITNNVWREWATRPLQTEVVVLGGAFFVNGNVNPAAEANIFGDPHAADIVFGSAHMQAPPSCCTSDRVQCPPLVPALICQLKLTSTL
jgi:Inosine-uridine preferring nucleoside hydrolase